MLSCAQQTKIDQQPITSLSKEIKEIHEGILEGYLSKDEMQLIFSKLLPDDVMQTLSAKEIAWLKLFIAVSERKGSDMYRYGLDLLSTESDLPITATEFLISTAMIGALMEGDKKGAFTLWRSFKSKRSFSRETEILFGILEANALPPNL